MKFSLVLLMSLLTFVHQGYSQVGELTYNKEGKVLDTQKYDSTDIVIDVQLKDSILDWCCVNRDSNTRYYMTCYITSYKVFTDDEGNQYHSFMTIREGDSLKAEFILQLDHCSYTLIPYFTYTTQVHHYVAGGPGVKLNITS